MFIGSITGPWVQSDQPLWEADGGHGMIFKTFDGRLLVALHQPNQSPNERARFFAMEDRGESITLKTVK